MFGYGQKVFGLGLSLARANFKLRTEGSYLGVLWYLLDPILLFTILIFVFGSNLGAAIENYPLYLIWGLVMFNFFSTVTTQAATAIAGNSLFIKSMKIRSEALVLSVVFQTIFSHFFEVLVLATLMFYFGVSLWGLVIYLPIFIFFTLFTLGVSFVLAALGVYISDLNNVWKFFIQLLFFATPIFYAASPKWLLSLNPLAAYLAVTRGVIVYHDWPGVKIVFLIVSVSLLSLVVGWGLFNRVKNNFAENL